MRAEDVNLREMGEAIDRSLVEGGLRRPLDGLTERELLVFRAVETFIGLHGYSPTVRELRDLTGLPTGSVVHDVLRGLRRKELVSWEPRSPRTLRPTRNQPLGRSDLLGNGG